MKQTRDRSKTVLLCFFFSFGQYPIKYGLNFNLLLCYDSVSYLIILSFYLSILLFSLFSIFSLFLFLLTPELTKKCEKIKIIRIQMRIRRKGQEHEVSHEMISRKKKFVLYF